MRNWRKTCWTVPLSGYLAYLEPGEDWGVCEYHGKVIFVNHCCAACASRKRGEPRTEAAALARAINRANRVRGYHAT